MQKDNYRDFIGQKVNVEIACYSAGLMYPDENILVDITETHYVFKSDEIDTPDGLWKFNHTDKDCSCELSLCDIEKPE